MTTPTEYRDDPTVVSKLQERAFKQLGLFWSRGLSLVPSQESLQSSLWWGIE